MMRRGFTIADLLFAIGLIAIIAAIVIMAINPTKILVEECKKEPTRGNCQEILKREEGSPSGCIKSNENGCCIRGHEERDHYGLPLFICDEYVPLAQ